MAEIIIAKYRNSPTGQIDLRFVPRLTRFENVLEPSARRREYRD